MNLLSELIEKAEKQPTRANQYEIVDEFVIDQYVLEVAKLATKPNNLKVIYTPLHESGLKHLLRFLKNLDLRPR